MAFGLAGFSHEDDCERALSAAAALGQWFAGAGSPFACGISSGRVFQGTLGPPCRRESMIIGDCIIMAARLMQAARAATGAGANGAGAMAGSDGARRQEVLCDTGVASSATAATFRAGGSRSARTRNRGYVLYPLSPIRIIKGASTAVPVFRVEVPSLEISAKSPDTSRPSSLALLPSNITPVGAGAGASAGAGDAYGVCIGHSAFVGREAELARATAAIDAVLSRGSGSTVVVVGDAGECCCWPTRLLEEMEDVCTARGMAVLRGGPPPLEATVPLWALRGVVASALRQSALRRGLLTSADAGLLWACLFEDPSREAAAAGSGGSGKGWLSQRNQSYMGSRSRTNMFDGNTGLASALFEVGLVGLRVAECVSRLLAGLEREGAGLGKGAPRPVALFIEDAHLLDSASWFVLRCLRDVSASLLLVISTRPTEDPPRDFAILAGLAVDRAGPGTISASSSEASRKQLDGAANVTPGLELAESVPVVPLELAEADDREDKSSTATDVSRAEDARLPPLRAPVRVELIELKPLSPAAASSLLDNLWPAVASWPAAEKNAVIEKAGGVPLFLVELARAQLDGGTFPRTIPDTIAQIVLARADRLSQAAQAVARLAAVIGAGFTAEATAAAARPNGMAPDAIRAGLRDLVRAGLARAHGSSDADPLGLAIASQKSSSVSGAACGTSTDAWPPANLHFSFTHALVKAALYEATPLSARRRVHLAYGAYLAARDTDMAAAAAAQHFRLAGNHAECLVHLQRAALFAYRSNALLEARRAFSEIACTIDDQRMAGDVPPIPESLRASAGLSTGSNSVKADSGLKDPRQQRRWLVARACALRSWASIEYYLGRTSITIGLSRICAESLGERLPANVGSTMAVIRRLARVAKLVVRGARTRERSPELGSGVDAVDSEAREALVESLALITWSVMKAGVGSGPDAYQLASEALVRACAISDATPDEALALVDLRVRANFGIQIYISPPSLSSLLTFLGMHKIARKVNVWYESLADRLDSPDARFVVANHRAIHLCASGRFREGAAAYRAAIGNGGLLPIGNEARWYYATALALMGNFAEATRVVQESLAFASRFGIGEHTVNMATLVDACCCILLGKSDKEAAARASRAEQMGSEGWVAEWTRAVRAILAWRGGDEAAAQAAVDVCLAFWRRNYTAMLWAHSFVPIVVMDFALHRLARARADLAVARSSEPVSPFFACLRPRRPRSAPPPVRPRVSPVPEASANGSAVEVRASTPPAKFGRAGAAAVHPEAADARPGARLRLLRAARASFAASGLRCWEALAALRLARSPACPAAEAAEAAAAAARIAAETGLRIPAASRTTLPDEFISMWA
eukprot:tig00000955_g5802.t1